MGFGASSRGMLIFGLEVEGRRLDSWVFVFFCSFFLSLSWFLVDAGVL